MIDEFLKEHPEAGITPAYKLIDQKYVRRIIDSDNYYRYTEYCDKFTGEQKIVPKPHIKKYPHNSLQNAVLKFLNENEYTDVQAEKQYVDIRARDKNGKLNYYELKTQKVKYAIR